MVSETQMTCFDVSWSNEVQIYLSTLIHNLPNYGIDTWGQFQQHLSPTFAHFTTLQHFTTFATFTQFNNFTFFGIEHK
jgi:hypothetical protein